MMNKLVRKSHYFEVRPQLAVHLDVYGDGYPLLCLPGFLSSSYLFELLVPYLIKEFSLILLDNRGMGKSENAGRPYTIHDLACDGKVVMERLGYGQYAVMGVSMGGYIAQQLAITAPSAVTHLILLVTSGPGREFFNLPAPSAEELRRTLSKGEENSGRAILEATLSPSFCRHHPLKVKQVLQLAQERNHFEVEEGVLQLQAAREFVAQEHFPWEKIQSKTLIMNAQNDNVVPVENGEILQVKINNSKLSVISGSGHLCIMEKPEEIAKVIKQFYRKKL